MTRVLVTGAAGAVGRPVCRELVASGHHVRALDRVAIDDEAIARDAVIADITDATAVLGAMKDIDTVIHLAAEPHDVAFPLLVPPNVLGLYNVMNGAREAGVRRVILTSSIQVLGRRADSTRPASVHEAHPGNHYALTKLWAEAMGEMYARRFGMVVLAARLAWLVRNPGEAKHMVELGKPELYLSPRDAGRFFARAVDALAKAPSSGAPGLDGPADQSTATSADPPTGWFEVVYAASLGGERAFDMEPARRLLGYEAQDRWPEGLGFSFDATR